jgi:hypothetical protein
MQPYYEILYPSTLAADEDEPANCIPDRNFTFLEQQAQA